MKRRGASFLPVVLLIAYSHAGAQATNVAVQLTREMRYGQAFDDALNECLDRVNNLDVEALISGSPDLFGGIVPSDKFWPDASALYKDMLKAGCRNYDKAAAERAFAAELSKGLSPSEQQKILEFYRSSLGQSFVQASIKANAAANRASSPDINSDEAFKAYGRGL